MIHIVTYVKTSLFFLKKTKMTGRLNWPVEQIEKYHVYEKRCKINNYGKVLLRVVARQVKAS